MTNELDKIDSKYKDLVKEFIELKIENPKLSVRKFSDVKKIPHQSFDNVLCKNPLIWENILSETRKRYHLKSADVDESLYQKALKGDPRAIELWYKFMEKWNPSEPHAGGTIIQIVFGPGMCSEDEQTLIEMKKVGPTEIIGDEKDDPFLSF